MELSLLLIEKIASMFVMMFFGFLLVKCRILKVSASTPLSKLTLYVIAPCIMIDGLQLDRTDERISGLLLALVAAVVVHIIYILLTRLLCRPLRLTRVEENSTIFSNGGGLIFPIAAYCLGEEWMFYVSAYIVVQVILYWTYMRSRLSGERRIELKKILLNVNILSVAVGLALFLSDIRLPKILGDAVSSLGEAIGPMSMLVLGILLADIRKEHLADLKRILLVCALRLLVLPACIALLFAFSGALALHPLAENILLVSLLSASAPVGSTVVQMAQIYDCEATYAGEINTISTLFCIITMPLVIGLYQFLV